MDEAGSASSNLIGIANEIVGGVVLRLVGYTPARYHVTTSMRSA
jgi:hypothetical protein